MNRWHLSFGLLFLTVILLVACSEEQGQTPVLPFCERILEIDATPADQNDLAAFGEIQIPSN